MGSVFGDVIGKIASHVEPETAHEIGNVATKTLSSLEGVANRTDVGKFVLGRVHVFEQAKNKALTDLTAGAKTAFEKTGKMVDPGVIQNQAQAVGIKAGFGENHELLGAAYTHATHTEGPLYAQTLADHVAMYLKDTQKEPIFKKGLDGKSEVVGYKGNISKSKSDALKNKNSVLDSTFNTGASYHRTMKIEKSLMGYFSKVQIPFLVLNHIGLAIANPIQTESLGDLTKALGTMLKSGGYKDVKESLLNTGIFGDETFRAYRDMYAYKHGVLNKLGSKVGVPNLGEILGKAFNHPGFSPVRDWTLALDGAAVKLSTERFAKELLTGDKLAEIRLRERGLNLDLIRKQGGVLTPDQLETAIYRGVDHAMFLRTNRMRGYYAQHDAFTRMATMYHNFVTRQGVFLGREFMTAWKSGNTMQIAKTMAMLAVGYPTVGLVTQGLMDFTKGQNGFKNTEDRLHTLAELKNHPLKSIEQYFISYAHAAAFGIAADYLHGALHHELANSLIGPIYGTAVTDVEDIVKGKIDQLGRDVLNQGVKVIGRPLARKLFPAKKKSKSSGFKFQGLKMKGFKKF